MKQTLNLVHWKTCIELNTFNDNSFWSAFLNGWVVEKQIFWKFSKHIFRGHTFAFILFTQTNGGPCDNIYCSRDISIWYMQISPKTDFTDVLSQDISAPVTVSSGVFFWRIWYFLTIIFWM